MRSVASGPALVGTVDRARAAGAGGRAAKTGAGDRNGSTGRQCGARFERLSRAGIRFSGAIDEWRPGAAVARWSGAAGLRGQSGRRNRCRGIAQRRKRDQVYLSLCLTLLSAASRQGLWLPLVLDEPFERLDARGTAALAAVLDGFCRQGHQVLVFTRKQDATERLVSIGAAVHNIASLRQWRGDTIAVTAESSRKAMEATKAIEKNRKDKVPSTEYSAPRTARRRKKKPTDQSDAA